MGDNRMNQRKISKHLLLCLVALALFLCTAFYFAKMAAWNMYTATGMAAYKQGQYALAEKDFSAAVDEAEKFGPQDMRLGMSLNSLVEVYRAEGKDAEAEKLYNRFLQIYEKTLWQKALSSNNLGVAGGLNQLAGTYSAQGKYAEAEKLYNRALEMNEKSLGPNNPRVASILNNLAGLYRAQWKYAEAEKLEARAKAIRAKPH
jgi:tetratricopeptide (TPR) repeat protein